MNNLKIMFVVFSVLVSSYLLWDFMQRRFIEPRDVPVIKYTPIDITYSSKELIVILSNAEQQDN